MTITLPLEPQKEAKLIAVAESKGMTANELLSQAIDKICLLYTSDAADE